MKILTQSYLNFEESVSGCNYLTRRDISRSLSVKMATSKPKTKKTNREFEQQTVIWKEQYPIYPTLYSKKSKMNPNGFANRRKKNDDNIPIAITVKGGSIDIKESKCSEKRNKSMQNINMYIYLYNTYIYLYRYISISIWIPWVMRYLWTRVRDIAMIHFISHIIEKHRIIILTIL